MDDKGQQTQTPPTMFMPLFMPFLKGSNPWTVEEDQIMLEAYKSFGSRWAKMSKILPGRTKTAIQSHFCNGMQHMIQRHLAQLQGCDEVNIQYTKMAHCDLTGIDLKSVLEVVRNDKYKRMNQSLGDKGQNSKSGTIDVEKLKQTDERQFHDNETFDTEETQKFYE